MMNDKLRERGEILGYDDQAPGELPMRLDSLKSQLIGFTVRDSQGQTMGRITDLTLESESQLNLIISRLGDRAEGFVKVSSDLIEKIEYATNSVFVLLTPEHLDALPEYEPGVQGAKIDPLDLPGEWVEPVSSSPNQGDLAIEERSHQHQIDEESSLADFKHIRKEVIASNIPLLEERLVVNHHKRKVGEVVVRKEIETRMIEVPVRREKLIVEQVSPEYKKLSEIILGEGDGYRLLSEENPETVQAAQIQSQDTNRVTGEFHSPEIAARILEEIAKRQPNGCSKVRVELVVEEERFRNTYQSWFDRYSTPQS